MLPKAAKVRQPGWIQEARVDPKVRDPHDPVADPRAVFVDGNDTADNNDDDGRKKLEIPRGRSTFSNFDKMRWILPYQKELFMLYNGMTCQVGVAVIILINFIQSAVETQLPRPPSETAEEVFLFFAAP